MIKKTELSWIIVSDLNKAKEFYTSIGLKVLEFKPEYKWMELGTIEGNYRIGVAEEKEPGANAIIVFTVENIEEEIKNLKNKNVNFLDDIIEIPGNAKMITFIDNDNNKFQLYQNLKNN